MELGALVCTPTAPRCSECPLAARCVARQLGQQETIPARTPPPETTRLQETAVVVWRDSTVLLAQRPLSGRWAGLWEFPHAPLLDGEAHETAAARLLHDLIGLQARLGPELLTIRHGITRYHITLTCFESAYVAGEFHSDFYVRGRWLNVADLAAYPVSAPQRRLARFLISPSRQRRLF
jgi:A/G-specific adenine glycosylase